jgi:N-acetylmuramoyl-L-alanine amidase
MRVIERPSPNFDARNGDVDMVILHYTGMESGAAALERLCDPLSKVSAHYVVEEDGRVFQLVAEERRAWHAGVASWKGESNINARSIGIEIVNPGHEWGYQEFPRRQIDAVIELLDTVAVRWSIAPTRVLGHSDVAPMRKEDPGERFPWGRLAQAALAIEPFDGPGRSDIAYDDALRLLREIGYEVPEVAPGKPAPAATILAFQRRFCPPELGQGLNPRTKAAIVYAADAFRNRS